MRRLIQILFLLLASLVLMGHGTWPDTSGTALQSATSPPLTYGDSTGDVTWLFPSEFHSPVADVGWTINRSGSLLFDGSEPDVLSSTLWNGGSGNPVDAFEHAFEISLEATYSAGEDTRFHPWAEQNIGLERAKSTITFDPYSADEPDDNDHMIFLDSADKVTGVGWVSDWNPGGIGTEGENVVIYWANHDPTNDPTNSIDVIVDPIWTTTAEVGVLQKIYMVNVYNTDPDGCGAQTADDLIGQSHVILQAGSSLTLRYYAGLDTAAMNAGDCVAMLGDEDNNRAELTSTPTIAEYADISGSVVAAREPNRYMATIVDGTLGKLFRAYYGTPGDTHAIMTLQNHGNYAAGSGVNVWSSDPGYFHWSAYPSSVGVEVFRLNVGAQDGTYIQQASSFWGPVWFMNPWGTGAYLDPSGGDNGIAFRAQEDMTESYDYELAAANGKLVPVGTDDDFHGPAFWGKADAADNFDTGNDVCGDRDMDCQSTISFATIGTPAEVACTNEYGTDEIFIAMCK